MKLSERVFICPSCNLTMCRDKNAAHNIKAAGERQLSGAVYQIDKAA
jgi:transposase